jgi:HlyD family secretion protein
MLKLVRKLFRLLTAEQRKRFFGLQLLLLLMAAAELAGVGSIAPFMALVGDMGILEKENAISTIYQSSGFSSERQFVFALGVGVLIVLVLSATISIFSTWRMSMFATRIGAEIADRLYAYYLQQDWTFHASGSSAQQMRKIANETTRLTDSVLLPLVSLNSRMLSVTFISTALFVYDPKAAMAGILIFSLTYILLYRIVQRRLYENGVRISEMYDKRFSLMNIGFGGIKELLLLGRSKSLISQFEEAGVTLARSQGVNSALWQVPRYAIELIAFGALIGLVLYLIETHHSNLGVVLPLVSVYAFAGYKLLPAIQSIYYSFAEIRANIPAFEAIMSDLEGSLDREQVLRALQDTTTEVAVQNSPLKYIRLANIRFTYPGQVRPTLDSLELTVEAGSVVGIVGASGAGKSTMIDILMGLLEPQQGQLIVDDETIHAGNLRAWQNSIGYVPQAIYLAEGSIAENVAFGIPSDLIDYKEVRNALELAHLGEMVRDLPDGIHATVGDKGVRLSGGQRQRIAIARALYHHADVLVFDEATSALDGVTERLIMEAIHDFRGKKTIILIAHRMKTVRQCDMIHLVGHGKILSSGTYDNLIKSSSLFREMEAHS